MSGVTPEQILGDYWNDPLFGVASADDTVFIDVLSGRIWPISIDVSKNSKVRVVVTNKTSDAHMLAFSNELDKLSRDKNFKALVEDELYHAAQSASYSGQHSHSSSNVDDAKSIVREIKQNPSVFVNAGEVKEIVVYFDQPGKVEFSCMIEFHSHSENIGWINVE